MTEALQLTLLFPAGEVQVARFLGVSLTGVLLWNLDSRRCNSWENEWPESYFVFFSPPKPMLGPTGPYFFISIKIEAFQGFSNS